MDDQHINLAAGIALAGSSLIQLLIPTLVKKGVISAQEAREMVDSAILGLEEQTARMPADFQPAGAMARASLEAVLGVIHP